MINRESPFYLSLSCSSLPEGALDLVEATGREELGQLWSFELTVRPTGAPLALEDLGPLMAGGASIRFGPEKQHPIHGVIRGIHLAPGAEEGVAVYRLRFVPKVWDAGMTVGSWIHLDKSADRILADALTSTGLVEGEDFEIALGGTYPVQEHVVQYEESVLDFVCRIAEHWGIFFFWEHGAERSKMIFADHNGAFAELPDQATVPFSARESHSDDQADSEAIHRVEVERSIVPARFELREYNYRIPSVKLHAGQDASPEGIGTVHVHGEHFQVPDEGAFLALVRAQEAASRELRMRARGRLRAARAGSRFELLGHPMGSLDRAYAVIAVEHTFDQGGAEGGGYSNALTLLPLEVAYRPPKRTKKPKIHGVIHGKIDEEREGDGVHTPIDEWGRYKVKLPFDVAGKEGGRATCWIRKAAASAGAGYGMHLPLHAGTEVAIYYLDGDPDRPIIAGAVPNFEDQSPVTSQNANTYEIRTRGNASIRFVD